jgi:hypothetical protein
MSNPERRSISNRQADAARGRPPFRRAEDCATYIPAVSYVRWAEPTAPEGRRVDRSRLSSCSHRPVAGQDNGIKKVQRAVATTGCCSADGAPGTVHQSGRDLLT